ncbi:MAG TPA: hypothetical protein VFX19_13550 [Dehalococcoidia bacterium]|nr:hypothetical protein [Dehalococcoidia bacterium]
MGSPGLLTRVIAAGLPLIVIALVFGGAGYALKQPDVEPIPQLPAVEEPISGVRGIIQSLAGDQLTLTTPDGVTHTYKLTPDARIEILQPASAGDIAVGDWLNGGAIPNSQTVYALTGLVLIPDPVVTP